MVLRFVSSNEPSLVMLWKGNRMDRWNPARQETPPQTHLCNLGQIRDTFQVLREDTDLMAIMVKDAHVSVCLVAFRGPCTNFCEGGSSFAVCIMGLKAPSTCSSFKLSSCL